MHLFFGIFSILVGFYFSSFLLGLAFFIFIGTIDGIIINYKRLQECPLEDYNEMKNYFIFGIFVSIFSIGFCIYYGLDKQNKTEVNPSSLNINHIKEVSTSTPKSNLTFAIKNNIISEIICSKNTCLFNGACINKAPHSYCVKNDPYNAWKCEKGYIDTGITCILPSKQKETKSCNAYVKGNITFRTAEKIYHVPGCENYYDVVINSAYGEKYFCSEQDAKNAGWRKARNCP